MASDLAELTFIPAASHSAVKRSSAAEGHGLKKPTLSAKSRDVTLRFPYQTPSSPRLHLQILSMKTTNRIGDEESWRSPTRTVNEFNWVPRMWTQLLLWWYRDWIACWLHSDTLYSCSTSHDPLCNSESEDLVHCSTTWVSRWKSHCSSWIHGSTISLILF